MKLGKLFFWTLIIVLLAGGLLWILSTCSRSSHPSSSFSAGWKVNDSWQVRYTLELSRDPKEASTANITTQENITYTYRVTEKTQENSRDIFRVTATPATPGWPEWRLTFDVSSNVLVKVEELLPGNQSITHTNPFGLDAWMANADEYHFLIIHDYPNLPDPMADEQRTLSAPDSHTEAFTQTVQVSGNDARIVMERTDPVTGQPHTTTMVWQKGKKWWREAAVRVGNEVKVLGVML